LEEIAGSAEVVHWMTGTYDPETDTLYWE
jgi:hypothetical protein